MKPQTITRRVQTILKGFAKRGSYTLPNGSIVIGIESFSTGKPGPLVRVFRDNMGGTMRACDGGSLLFHLDPATGRYVYAGKV